MLQYLTVGLKERSVFDRVFASLLLVLKEAILKDHGSLMSKMSPGKVHPKR